jgi:hypothetical protein
MTFKCALRKTTILLAALAPATLLAAWSWTSNMGIVETYFHPLAPGTAPNYIVVAMDQNFHNCGWNNAGNINSSVVGESQYKMLASAVLTASTTNRPLALLVDGCDGDRAKIHGVKLGR